MTVTDEVPAPIVCSFCIKPAAEVKKMVAGPGVYICDACVGLCVELIKNQPAGPADFTGWDSLSDDDLLATMPKVAAAGIQVDGQLARFVAIARTRGITWSRIGGALGMTRQSAWERFSGEE